MSKAKFRVERDSMGEIRVPADKYWGAQTQRSLENFPIGGERMPEEMIRAIGFQKKAAALANTELKIIDRRRGRAIARAAGEVASGKLADHFPLVVWQTGSGTQTNMNANEVIANRANEILGAPLGAMAPVHPNDHVNAGQSSNDSFPTAMHIAAVLGITERLLPSVDKPVGSLSARAADFGKIVKMGRTHLQDATPLTLEQEFSAFASQIETGAERLGSSMSELLAVPQGGTAVGTGLNTVKGFDRKFCAELQALTGHKFRPAENKFAGIAAHHARQSKPDPDRGVDNGMRSGDGKSYVGHGRRFAWASAAQRIQTRDDIQPAAIDQTSGGRHRQFRGALRRGNRGERGTDFGTRRDVSDARDIAHAPYRILQGCRDRQGGSFEGNRIKGGRARHRPRLRN
jgi:hypothetical protein